MKKIIAGLLLVTMFSLVACGTNEPVETNNDNVSTSTTNSVQNEQAATEPTTTPTVTVEPTSTPVPTEKVEPTTTPVPTETVEQTTTSIPTETPVESEEEEKDYYIDPNTGEKVEREPVVEETTPTPQVEERIYYGEVTEYEENGTVILIHVECTHEGNFIGLCWGGGKGSIVRFRFENAEDVAKQYPIGTVVKMVSTGEPLMCPLPCWGELSNIKIVTE